MASFNAKTGWKRPRKWENKNYRSPPFLPDAKLKILKKIAKKLKKLKNTISVRSVPTRRVIENSNKIAKKFKKLKNTIMASFQVKTGWKRPRKRKYKNYRSVSFQPDVK